LTFQWDEEGSVILGEIEGTSIVLGADTEAGDGAPIATSAAEFVRGDAYLDGAINLLDVVAILQHVVRSVTHSCPAALDMNGDDEVDAADAVLLASHILIEAPAPAARFPASASNSKELSLACESFESCP